MKTTKNYEVNYCKICRTGYRTSKRTWWIRVFDHINTLPALLMNHRWSCEQVALGPGKHSIFTHFQKDRNCDICLRTRITRASCRRLAGTVVPKAENFGDLITADHKVLSEGCESRHTRRTSRNEQTPNTKIKMKDTKEYKAICCMTCRTGCRNSEKIWSMNVARQCHGETLSLEIETLPVLLMNYQWSREQKWNRIRT